MLDLTSMSDTDLGTLATQIAAVQDERRALANVDAAIDQAMAARRSILGMVEGDPYRPPTSYRDAYPKGWVVQHADHRWQSTRDGATDVPGEGPDWQLIADRNPAV